MNDIITGTKIYKFDADNKPIVYRIIDMKDDKYVLIEWDGKSNKHIQCSLDEIKDEYTILNPDAFVNIMTTSTNFNNQNIEDVFVCVNKAVDLANDVKDPSIVLRQNVYSPSKNAFNGFEKIFIGECFRSDALPNENSKITDYLEFDKYYLTYGIAAYIDDNIHTMLKCVPTSVQDKIKTTLSNIRVGFKKQPNIKGVSSDLKSLMIDNNFMFNYMAIFNVVKLDFTVDISINRNNDGDIVFNKKQKKMFEDLLRKHVNIEAIIKYDKDIDISKIVQTTHGMFSDKMDTIYLIAYSVISDYPVDDDIRKAFGL